MVLAERVKRPGRLQRSAATNDPLAHDEAVFVGPGSKWANPLRNDADVLRGEPDVEAAYQRGGWKEAAKLLYRDHLQETWQGSLGFAGAGRPAA
jgi:hypothetical protein